MTTPHEAVAGAVYEATKCPGSDLAATAAIKALREGAKERLHVQRHIKLGDKVMVEQLMDKEIIDAVLGPPNEVPE